MTITEMLGQSAILTLLGMGVVFTFLIIMVFFISLISKVIKLLKLDKENEPAAGVSPANTGGGQNNAIIAVISAAVRQKQNN